MLSETNVGGTVKLPSKICWEDDPAFMTVKTDAAGRTLFFNLVARRILSINVGTNIAVEYDAGRDALTFQMNPKSGNVLKFSTYRRVSIGRMLVRDCASRLLGKERYTIIKNEEGADPPYLIPLEGRTRPA